jgi:hypothetical protein
MARISFLATLTLFLTLLFFASAAEATAHKQTLISRRSRAPHLSSRAIALPSGWSIYKGPGNDGGGCYLDQNVRLLTAFTVTSNTMTVSTCLTACQSRGYIYGGLEAGIECYVGSTLATVLTPVCLDSQRTYKQTIERVRILVCSFYR